MARESPTQQSGTPAAAGSTSGATSGAQSDRQSQIPISRESSGAGASSTGGTTDVSRAPVMPFASPFSLMRALVEDMFSDFGQLGMRRPRAMTRPNAPTRSMWLPAIDVSKRDDQVVVTAELAGLDPKDVNVEISDDSLIISGERAASGGDSYHNERVYGTFYRAIPLPENVDTNQISASFKNGVLEVDIPMSQQQESRRRRIDVKT